MSRISNSTRERVRALHACGYPAWQIADEVGLTIPQVTKILGI